jgi:hypothetical protein
MSVNNNPYKRKHNIRFRELENEHSKTNKTLIKGIFLLIYTHFESYLKQILLFVHKVDSSILAIEDKLEDVETDFSLIDKVFNRIGVSKNDLNPNLLLTLDYIRLKRNRLIHSNVQNISRSLNELIKNHGADLNNYWNNILPSKFQGINFKDKVNSNQLSFRIVIDIINVFRGISSEIDKSIIEKLSKIKITKKIVIPSFKEIQGKKINGLKIERLISKFKKYCDSDFALEVDDDILETFKSSIA